MGLYSHLTTEQLTARRDSYLAAIDARLTQRSAPRKAGCQSQPACYAIRTWPAAWHAADDFQVISFDSC